MSSIWKRIRSGTADGKGSHPAASKNTVTVKDSDRLSNPNTSINDSFDLLNSTISVIKHQDEQLFMGSIDKNVPDPLLIQSQYIKNVGDLLNNPLIINYFIHFLESSDGAGRYARFCVEVNNFVAATKARLTSYQHTLQEEQTTHSLELTRQSLDSDDLLQNSNNHSDIERSKCFVDELDNIDISKVNESTVLSDKLCDNFKNGESHKTLVNKDRQGLVLPDLVSGISESAASAVTPVSSPQTDTDHESMFARPKCSEGSLVKDSIPEFISEQQSVENDIKQNRLFNNSNTDILNSSIVSTTSNNDSINDSAIASPNQTSTPCKPAKPTQSIADEAVHIFNKYLSQDAAYFIEISDSERQKIMERICGQHREVELNCFEEVVTKIIELLEREYFPKFLLSDWYLRHQVDVLTSGSVGLKDILECDEAFALFMEYCEQSGGRGLLEFWVAASNFGEHLRQECNGSCDPVQAQTDAMVLYDRFFSLQARTPLGFSDKVRFYMESNICNEDGPKPTCFDLPLQISLHILNRDFLPGYLNSSLHSKYISEIVNTVRNSIEIRRRKERSNSEGTVSSSEASSSVFGGRISRHNTLLAAQNPSHAAYRINQPSKTEPGSVPTVETLNLRIDAHQIMDPDSLWRRKNFTKLSCGYINELGKFESEIQPEPDRKVEKSLSRTLKKFVNLEEDTEKESRAWAAAASIIEEVTSVTLSNQPSLRKGHYRSCSTSETMFSVSASPSRDNLSDVFPSTS